MGNIHWIGLLFWPFVIISFLSLLFGLYKRSVLFMLLSAITVLPMTLYLLGAENWLRASIIIPIIEVIAAILFWRNSQGRGTN